MKIVIFQGKFKLLDENNSMFSSSAFVFLYFSKIVFTVAILDKVKPVPPKVKIQITIFDISDSLERIRSLSIYTDSMVLYLCARFGSYWTVPAIQLFWRPNFGTL